jgi:diguanylate cyclase (GGDEF)-like protein/PAS domain S-box-containing protein
MSTAPAAQAGDPSTWDEIPGMVQVLAPDGQAQYMSPAARAFLGIAHEEALGAAWQGVLKPESRRQLQEALQHPRDFTLPLEMRLGDGRDRVVDCTAGWSARVQGFVCLWHDETDSRLDLERSREQADLFRLMTDNVPVLIAYYRSSDLKCVFANDGYARAFGLDVATVVGKTFVEVIGEEAARQIDPHLQAVLNHGRAVSYERALTAADSSMRWIEVNLLPHVAQSGTATVGVFVLISDITKHRLAEQAVRESEARLAKFMEASTEGIMFHKDGVVVDANPPMCELVGYNLDEMLGRQTLDFIAPEHVAKIAALLASGQDLSYESMLLAKNGQLVPVEFIVRSMLRGEDHVDMTIVRDLRDRHAAQARIHHLAHHDTLTGLPNRMSFMEQLDHVLIGARTRQSHLALLFIDLDHFKRVNDSLGHMVGDTLLRTVASRITSCLRATDIVARFGGDEFMVLLPGLPATGDPGADVAEVAQKLLAAIEVPVIAEGRPIWVTPSVGISLYPDDGESAHELVKHADSAMYLAKSRGRANYQFFEAGMARNAYAALVLEGQLAQALELGEFELYFQPQVRAKTGELVGAEALIRWNHPERGLLLPNEFIPLAERQRLMLRIGQWVLQESARCVRRWHAIELGVPTVAVNLSTLQFLSPGFIDAVSQVLPADGLDSGMLELELTERMLMDDMSEVKDRLARLRQMGLSISVDDFGTGYSSLGHLKNLPIDKLKIDRSFIRDLPAAKDSVAIASAIIQMGRSLGMTVVAEGVETLAQGEFLAAQGCDELQGYLISPALPLVQFEAWVRQRIAAPPST